MNRTKLLLLALPSALLLTASVHAQDTGNDAPNGPDLGTHEPQPPIPDACPADHDGNGMINFGDFLYVVINWGQPVTGSQAEERIGFAHLLEVMNSFGSPCS